MRIRLVNPDTTASMTAAIAGAAREATAAPVPDLESCGEATLAQIEGAARTALERDRGGAIVLGCAGMAPPCATRSDRLGVPVIDGMATEVPDRTRVSRRSNVSRPPAAAPRP